MGRQAHFQTVITQRDQDQAGETQGPMKPEEAPDSSWEVREDVLEKEMCDLNSEGKARRVPREEGIHGRGMVYTEARSEGKGGMFEEH